MNDLISRSALLAAYDQAHKGPPGGARKLIEEAPAVEPAQMKLKTFLQLFVLAFGGLCLVMSAMNMLLAVTDGIWLQMALSLLGMSLGLATSVFAFEI